MRDRARLPAEKRAGLKFRLNENKLITKEVLQKNMMKEPMLTKIDKI